MHDLTCRRRRAVRGQAGNMTLRAAAAMLRLASLRRLGSPQPRGAGGGGPGTSGPAAAGITGDARRRATAIAATVVCLLLVLKVFWAAATGGTGQLPFVVALFVLPLLYVFPGTRPFLLRNRWQVLAVQAILTWAPFAIYGGRWVVGIGGLLAGLVLLTVPGLVSWLVAALLLAADMVVRVTAVGLPYRPAWYGAVWAVVVFADDALFFFGIVRLAQMVGEVQDARGQAAVLAVGRERLQAAEALQSALGDGLAAVGARAVAAFQAIPASPAQAHEHVTAAGVAARNAVAQARALAAGRRSPSGPGPAAAPAAGAVIGARLAWAVLVAVLLAYATQNLDNVIIDRDGPGLGTGLAACIATFVALQLRHSWSARQGGRPRAWPMTLALQAALAYICFLPSVAGELYGVPFLAGSILLLVPGWQRWAWYAAVAVSWAALYATVPIRGTVGYQGMLFTVYEGANIALLGLLVYGLSRLAGLARQLEALRDELTRMAVVAERLRVARDVHDLLGLGLSAIALKADLIAALIGRDDARAAAEIEEMSRICAAARADIRLITGDDRGLSLAAELAAAGQILASAGIEVSQSTPGGPLPAAADTVLAPVLREAVTNVLRHAAATTCTIDVAAGDGALQLRVSNDGAPRRPAAGPPGEQDRAGCGVANLQARVRAAGGQLTSHHGRGRFELTARIPLPGTQPSWAALRRLDRSLLTIMQPGAGELVSPGAARGAAERSAGPSLIRSPGRPLTASRPRWRSVRRRPGSARRAWSPPRPGSCARCRRTRTSPPRSRPARRRPHTAAGLRPRGATAGCRRLPAPPAPVSGRSPVPRRRPGGPHRPAHRTGSPWAGNRPRARRVPGAGSRACPAPSRSARGSAAARRAAVPRR